LAQHKLECVEVIQIREHVQKFDICSDKIIVLTQNSILKVLVGLLCSWQLSQQIEHITIVVFYFEIFLLPQFSCTSRSTQTFYRSKHV
jgi:hypothetical protein